MTVARLSVLSAILAIAATPALAAWDNIGSVDIQHGRNWDVQKFDFGGPVERLQFHASQSPVDCRNIRATFGNGNTRTIFSGRLRKGQDKSIQLPGDVRNISRLSFECSATERPGATIKIRADIGHYRDEWRRSPNWQRTWSRVFNWGSDTVNNWRYLGSEVFDGRHDQERAYAGWNGRHVDALALMPKGSDAHCAHITATFRNGQKSVLASNAFLPRDRYHKLDIPGDTRNLSSLRMVCASSSGGRVTMQIYASD